jgi:hypothetical protein
MNADVAILKISKSKFTMYEMIMVHHDQVELFQERKAATPLKDSRMSFIRNKD